MPNTECAVTFIVALWEFSGLNLVLSIGITMSSYSNRKMLGLKVTSM